MGVGQSLAAAVQPPPGRVPAARRRPLRPETPRSGRGRRTRGAPGRAYTPAGSENRSVRSRRPPPQAGGGHTYPREQGHAAPALSTPLPPDGSPRSPGIRTFHRRHVASGQPVVPTCPGKPRSSRPSIGSLKGGTCLRPLLIGSLGEPGSLRIGACQQKGRGA